MASSLTLTTAVNSAIPTELHGIMLACSKSQLRSLQAQASTLLPSTAAPHDLTLLQARSSKHCMDNGSLAARCSKCQLNFASCKAGICAEPTAFYRTQTLLGLQASPVKLALLVVCRTGALGLKVAVSVCSKVYAAVTGASAATAATAVGASSQGAHSLKCYREQAE
jgi:hypothetical protein